MLVKIGHLASTEAIPDTSACNSLRYLVLERLRAMSPPLRTTQRKSCREYASLGDLHLPQKVLLVSNRPDVPAFAVEQDVLFWQYVHTAYPTPADGVVELEVFSQGPVLIACTTRL